ncbi:WD40-repeat-containing domain protein [Mycena pura]|uniref:Ribosome biogenesis protein NSA1 n=1 Tax=Mycena pura TaxID=153505 RepID=A0AAD6YKB7_9AGAR|nr:WD40-repeat-containing domain protein [Mycena pura]
MPRFLTGDDLGNIKALQVTTGGLSELTTLYSAKSSVAALSVTPTASTSKSVAAAFADGSIEAFTLEDDKLQSLHQWKETRLKQEQSFIGLQVTDRGIYSCTSNGALRLVPHGLDEKQPIFGSLPTRLSAWRLASDHVTFAYGGNEVDLSVWDTEKAFLAEPQSSVKRKRDAMFPGEIWRANNVQNDGLGLRQPVRITSLAYLFSCHHLLTGTQFGDIRRYDIRAARRAVSNWKGIGKVGGVKVVEKGLAEHEVFIGDHGCNLFSLDLRIGRVLYSYKGLSGAVTSMAPSPSMLVSTALDRYCRVHTSFPPPPEAGQNLDNKGQVVEKLFMTSIPTVVVWNGVDSTQPVPGAEAENDDVWDEMEDVGNESETDLRKKKRRRHISKATDHTLVS